MNTKTLDQHIEMMPGVPGGMPRIAGRPITVQKIAILHEWMGMRAIEIASENDLALADVHAALAYYFDHQVEIDQAIGEAGAINSLKTQPRFKDPFIRGVGSVLEFFPPPERFNEWRLGQDLAIDQWPRAVRSVLADMQENPAHGEDPS